MATAATPEDTERVAHGKSDGDALQRERPGAGVSSEKNEAEKPSEQAIKGTFDVNNPFNSRPFMKLYPFIDERLLDNSKLCL